VRQINDGELHTEELLMHLGGEGESLVLLTAGHLLTVDSAVWAEYINSHGSRPILSSWKAALEQILEIHTEQLHQSAHVLKVRHQLPTQSQWGAQSDGRGCCAFEFSNPAAVETPQEQMEEICLANADAQRIATFVTLVNESKDIRDIASPMVKIG